MNNSTIGIKVADGSFYPILSKDASRRKRLILTTVKEGQKSVQIDLYEGEGTEIDSERYIGSLLIENLVPGETGDSEIELLVGVESDSTVAAEAKDLGTGESQSLNVMLTSLPGDGVYDMPDFELDDEFERWSGEDLDELDELGDEVTASVESDASPVYSDDSLSEPDPGSAFAEPRRRKPLLLALFIIVGIAAVAALAILLYKVFEGPTIPPLEARPPAVEAPAGAGTPDVIAGEGAIAETGAGEAAQVEGAVADESEGSAGAREGPVAGGRQASADTGSEHIGGVWYWIRWGDTLWDLSFSFYRNPWQYGKIAEQNSIRNPDLIFAGTKIYIPEKE